MTQEITEYKIESGIPLPRIHVKYPFDKLNVGDSFLIPGMISTTQISGSVQGAARKLGAKFVTRKVDGGVRIWRIA